MVSEVAMIGVGALGLAMAEGLIAAGFGGGDQSAVVEFLAGNGP